MMANARVETSNRMQNSSNDSLVQPANRRAPPFVLLERHFLLWTFERKFTIILLEFIRMP
jgi:hypothetical protein